MQSATLSQLAVSGYRNLRIRPLKLASDRRSAEDPGSPVFPGADAAAEYLRIFVAE
jgi:hypothetical protein